jgi:prepilin-type processing-associated H-X9-DG protein
VHGRFARGLTSYLGNEGIRAADSSGVLFLNSSIRVTDIHDGSSNTLLVGERPPSADLIFGWWYAGWGQDRAGEGDSVLGVRTKNVQIPFAPDCPVGPYHFAPGDFNNQCDAFHFWSPHSGGANFVFADGSARFLTYSADEIMPALATRAGREVVEW